MTVSVSTFVQAKLFYAHHNAIRSYRSIDVQGLHPDALTKRIGTKPFGQWLLTFVNGGTNPPPAMYIEKTTFTPTNGRFRIICRDRTTHLVMHKLDEALEALRTNHREICHPVMMRAATSVASLPSSTSSGRSTEQRPACSPRATGSCRSPEWSRSMG